MSCGSFANRSSTNFSVLYVPTSKFMVPSPLLICFLADIAAVLRHGRQLRTLTETGNPKSGVPFSYRPKVAWHFSGATLVGHLNQGTPPEWMSLQIREGWRRYRAWHLNRRVKDEKMPLVAITEWLSKDYSRYEVRNITQENISVIFGDIKVFGDTDTFSAQLFTSTPHWISIASGESASFRMHLKKEYLEEQNELETFICNGKLHFSIFSCKASCLKLLSRHYCEREDFCRTWFAVTSKPVAWHVNIQVEK